MGEFINLESWQIQLIVPQNEDCFYFPLLTEICFIKGGKEGREVRKEGGMRKEKRRKRRKGEK